MSNPISRRSFLWQSALLSAAWPLLGASQPDSAPSALLKAPALRKGQTIGLITPASSVADPAKVDAFVAFLAEKGFQVKKGEHVLGKSGYLAGTDEDRAADLNRMFADPEVDAIICVRGGWGGARMLHLIDYEQIARAPKIFMGYSDVTSLLLAIHAKTGLVTFHGPVGLSNWDDFTWKHFRKVAMRKRAYRLPGNAEDPADLSIGRYTIREGQAQGTLLGGNLSVLSGMIGSDYLPSFDGSILLIEEVGEQVYRIDRFLTHLKLSGILDRVGGLIFGSCADCPEGEAKNKFTLREVLNDHLANWGKPAFFGTTVGHIAHQYTLPIGTQVRMDARKGTIKLLERSVV